MARTWSAVPFQERHLCDRLMAALYGSAYDAVDSLNWMLDVKRTTSDVDHDINMKTGQHCVYRSEFGYVIEFLGIASTVSHRDWRWRESLRRAACWAGVSAADVNSSGWSSSCVPEQGT